MSADVDASAPPSGDSEEYPVAIGDVIAGRFRIDRYIGIGAMGLVVEARHLELDDRVAMKFLRKAAKNQPDAVGRFAREARAAARLKSEHVATVIDVGEAADGTPYIVMEYLHGANLDDLLERQGPMPIERSVELTIQMCEALAEAHSFGIVHRDIKPANIFASQRGGVHDVAKLLDFGLVKERRDSSDDAARSGKFSGTPLYMAPEQAWSYDDVDGRADLYSLGAVAYCLLTGRPPFVSNSVMELLAAHQSEPVPPPSKFQAAVPPDLDQIVLRCLAKSPADRFADADALRSALAACSVANAWTEQDAASWWRNESQQESPAKLVLATPTLDDSRSPAPSSMAATVDAVTVEASASKRDD